MKIRYLGTNGNGGELDLSAVKTSYDRISCAYPDRAVRFCEPRYRGGAEADKLLAVWQWEPDGHAAGRYGSGDAGLDPVEHAPEEELARLSREITAAVEEIHAHPEDHPEAADYLASCREYGAILREIEEPYLRMACRNPDEELEAVTAVIGRRRTCSRQEMAEIIRRCGTVCDQGYSAESWAERCDDITLVSVTAGCVRYDQPGQLSGASATIMFAPRGVPVRKSWARRIVRV